MTDSPINLDEAHRIIAEGKARHAKYPGIYRLEYYIEYRYLERIVSELEAGRERIVELESRAKFYQEHNFVNAAPDGGYALRILQSYRSMCNYFWADVLGGEPTNPLCIEMNKVNEKRKTELDEAIAKLANAIIPQAEDADSLSFMLEYLCDDPNDNRDPEIDIAKKVLRRYLAAIEGAKP